MKPIVEEDLIRLVVSLVASEGLGSVVKIEVLCDTVWVDLTTDEIEISLVVPPGQVGQGTTIVAAVDASDFVLETAVLRGVFENEVVTDGGTTIVVAVVASGFVLETAVFRGVFGNEVATDGGTKIVVVVDTSGVVTGISVF